MCSSPKASHQNRTGKGSALSTTQLSASQHAQYAIRANAAWERREARRQQTIQVQVLVSEPSLLQQLWQLLFRSDR